jgi:hypothetical protein
MIRKLFYLSLFVGIAAILAGYYSKIKKAKLAEDLIKYGEENKITIEKSKTKSNPFKIEFNQNEWDLLLKKLELTRYFSRLDDKSASRFELGFDPEFARELVEHWRTKFNWTERVNYLNKFRQYKIEINGTVVHYVHVVTNSNKNLKEVPLLMVDGWPGSFFGFYKMIETIIESFNDFSFSIIVPSIPGKK